MAGGEVVLPTTVILRNRVTRLAGRLTGVHEIITERDAKFYVTGSAHTSQVLDKSNPYNGERTNIQRNRHLLFGKLFVNNRAQLIARFPTSNGFITTFNIAQITLKKGSLFTSETKRLSFDASYFIIESGSTLSADASWWLLAQSGGCGSRGCAGGSYASRGGGGYNGNAAGDQLLPFDSIFNPTSPGVGGAGSQGGSGGGHIRLIVGDKLVVDGRLTSNGGNAQVNNVHSGAGTGGSIHITSPAIIGVGVITSVGGRGYSWQVSNNAYGSGGGSGGRIALHLSFGASRNLGFKYRGTFSALGGIGHANAFASPGAVFIEEVVSLNTDASSDDEDANATSRKREIFQVFHNQYL
ncbi:uncharacterized protein LOC144746997 isoform X1 [Ciona intestinalis]